MTDHKTTQTAIRLSPELKQRMERISAEMIRRTGGSAVGHGLPTISKMCIERGLPLLEDELDLYKPKTLQQMIIDEVARTAKPNKSKRPRKATKK